MAKIEVIRMISWKEAEKKVESIGGLGGFFRNGMRWKDYLGAFKKESRAKIRPYANALKKYVIKNKIKQGGDWHQSAKDGVPLFNDDTVGMFSYRAWGDIMAAIWSEEEDTNYGYMDFYMDCCVINE